MGVQNSHERASVIDEEEEEEAEAEEDVLVLAHDKSSRSTLARSSPLSCPPFFFSGIIYKYICEF
jgi:hypothetical protein